MGFTDHYQAQVLNNEISHLPQNLLPVSRRQLMGVVQAVGSGGSGSGSQFQPSMARQNSWYNLPLDELENQFGVQGKTLGSMNIDELLKSMSSTEAAQPVRVRDGDGSSSTLQSQSSLNRALSKRTVDEVWKDIQLGEKAANGVVVKTEKDNTWGEMTLEDFLTKAGAYEEEENSLSPGMELEGLDTSQSLSAQYALSPAPSVGTMLDAQALGCKRGPPETVIERKLKRKIKNRESAARSRARKQAYHNELVSKVSSLEMDNMKLQKEKVEFDYLFSGDLSDKMKYQLRRTSSTTF
ncbi:hypothetical protein V2J09_010008 [Rumex salicifolius]